MGEEVRGWSKTAESVVALVEWLGANKMGAVLCPSGSHGDFVDGEVVPGDLPCPSCGAAL